MRLVLQSQGNVWEDKIAQCGFHSDTTLRWGGAEANASLSVSGTERGCKCREKVGLATTGRAAGIRHRQSHRSCVCCGAELCLESSTQIFVFLEQRRFEMGPVLLLLSLLTAARPADWKEKDSLFSNVFFLFVLTKKKLISLEVKLQIFCPLS